MAIFDPIRIGAAGAGGDYKVERSLRFNRGDNAYLTRTPASAGNRKTFTFSTWVKLGQTGINTTNDPGNGLFLSCGAAGTGTNMTLRITNNGYIGIDYYGIGGYYSSGRLRDPSAWYHCVWVMDTTESTAADRMKVYVNGNLFYNNSMGLSQNADTPLNNNSATTIGAYSYNTSHVYRLDAYLAEVNFIDGQAYDPTYFAETNAATGQWIPKKYTGSYGTNGFYLNFSDNSGTTATTLGKDSSGNGNNFTPNNFSVSAGVGNDSLEDSPTNNFCTLNPLAEVTNGNVTTSNGNLDAAFGSVSGGGGIGSSHVVRSGKWYWETTMTADSGGACHIGVLDENLAAYSGVQYYEPGLTAESYSYQTNGKTYNNNANQNYGASYTTGDVIGTKLDLDNGTIEFLKNNSSQGIAFTGLTGGFLPAYGDGNSAQTHSLSANFGQRAFSYTLPSGYKTLCSANLPDPTILLPNKHFGTILYTGNGSSRSVTDTTAVNFTPDWSWFKARSAAKSGLMYDAVRGNSKYIQTDSTSAEGTGSDSHTGFVSGGFSLGADTSTTGVNQNSTTYVAWNWNGGGSTVTNNDGTISAQVRANTTAGFSIVSYTGNGSNSQTVGHGLGVSPDVVILKDRSSNSVSNRWTVLHSYDTSKNLELNSNSAAFGHQSRGSITAVSSTTFTLSGSTDTATVNESGDNYIAYVLSGVEGYSKFGKYIGNGSTDGLYIYTGFRPAFLIVKNTSASRDWLMFDDKRSPSNVVNDYLFINLNEAEGVNSSTIGVDFTANGFKWRGSSSGNNYINSSGDHFIYLAFAESPFKNSRAR